MGLKSTRKILSVILTVIIAFGTVCFCASLVMSQTFAKADFVQKKMITSTLVNSCDAQLDAKYDVLEAKSGIPARVFLTVKNQYNTKDSLKQAVDYLFDENDSSLYNDTRIDYFYNLCVEYLDGNSIEYNEASVRNVAVEAAQIYSDSVGIHNADEIKHYTQEISKKCPKLESASLLFMAIGFVLMMLMHKVKADAYAYAGAGITGGAIATIIAAVVAVIAKVGANALVTPGAYQFAFYSMIRNYMLILLGLGVLAFVIGVALMAFAFYKLNQEKTRKEIRFQKIVAKL